MAVQPSPFHIVSRDYLRCRGCGQELLLDDPNNSPWVPDSDASAWAGEHCGKCGEDSDACECEESQLCGSAANSRKANEGGQP